MDIFEIERIMSALYHRKEDVLLEEIPDELQKDFKHFFIGKTFTYRDGVPHFHYHDFLQWFNKVVYQKGVTV